MWVILSIAIVALVTFVSFLAQRRRADIRSDNAAVRSLSAASADEGAVFEPAMVAGLPEPARRYFEFAIKPGARLHRAVMIEMQGDLGFGLRDRPGYRPFSAEQILAPPYGFVWQLSAGGISGSDGLSPAISWTRFWLFNLLPVVRICRNDDHRRSAFGRLVAEAAFWAPASLLPGPHVRWEAAGPHTARAVVECDGLAQAVDIALAPNGQPLNVTIQRWSAENADKTYRLQPFGGSLSDFRDFDGYCLPGRVEGGNHFGTSEYFPFFKADVTSIHAVEP